MSLRTEIDERYLQDNSHYFNIGHHRSAYKFLGVHQNGEGFQFSVWAPNAYQVFVTGDFNHWGKQLLEYVPGGIWTGYVKEAKIGHCYKYGIDHGNGYIAYKMDPFAFQHEIAPKDASIIAPFPCFNWTDRKWMTKRQKESLETSPLLIYEVHASSWKQHLDGSLYNLRELADELIPYVVSMGYTHIELMPVMDHPLDASWGYQITGYYAVCGRMGTIEDLQYFVNKAHLHDIGVILDWVPGHFCRNDYALSYFDGTPTFEYQDVNRANNIGWGTLNFDLGKTQVQSFLISNILFWINECHIDGIRVDAVSNMLYLDFDQGPWTPNEIGTNSNLEGIDFLKKLTTAVHDSAPGVVMIAEESTSQTKITHSIEDGGLGFDFKWNMGWMNDTLKFFELDPEQRAKQLTLITFVFMYQYNERYILPYSHDEVVHGKRSLLGKIPGNRFEQFSTLKLIQGYMAAQPGKVLNFMGNEFGQYLEWRYYEGLEWCDLQREFNASYHQFVKDVNQLVCHHKALYEWDHQQEGIQILEADAYDLGYLTFIRQGKRKRDFLIVAINFSNQWIKQIPVGVPYKGTYQIALNSDDKQYEGSTVTIPLLYKTQEMTINRQPYSIQLDLAPLSIIFLQPKRIYGLNR